MLVRKGVLFACHLPQLSFLYIFFVRECGGESLHGPEA